MNFREAPWGMQSAPPWRFAGMKVRVFALRASFGALNAWCAAWLDGASDSSFSAAAPVVCVCVADYPKMVVSGFEDLGFVTQREYFLMFPVLRRYAGVIPLEIGWAFPFIGVTNGMSMHSGHAILGLSKSIGDVGWTEADDGGFSSSVSMLALKTHSSASVQEVQPLLRVSAPTPVAAAPLPGGFPGGMLRAAALNALIPPELSPLVEAIDLGNVGFGLRQVRDPGAPTYATLTDVVRSRWWSSNENDGRLWSDATVDILDNATFPISATLGLQDGVLSGAGTRYTALAGWGMTLDMRMTAARLPAA